MASNILRWLFCLYFGPLYLSALFFTIMKIEDRDRKEKVYSKGKFSYLTMIKLSFIPVLNWAFVILAIICCFKSAKKK